jgi:hypothetical protein
MIIVLTLESHVTDAMPTSEKKDTGLKKMD